MIAACAVCSLLAISPALAATHRDRATHHHGHHRRRRRYRHHRRRHHHRRHHPRHHAHASRARATQTSTSSAPAGTSATAQPVQAPASAPCTNTTTPAGAAPSSVLDAAVLCLINQERTSRGLPALRESSELDTSAQSWTNWMVANGQFTHGSDFASRISAVGYDWQSAGENIATGFDTPQAVVAAWMASPDHCRNILDPSFRDVGTGLVDAPVAGYASGPATWTQDFGLTMSDSPLSTNTGPQSGCPYSS